MKILIVGVGASGNKAMMSAINAGVVKEEDTVLVNSTSKDIPKEYNGKIIIISPDDHGCGKEIKVARKYATDSIAADKFTDDKYKEYDSIIICTSTEGGTGSGATPVIARFFSEYYKRNVHVIAFTGFEDDVRGMANTIEFFKSMTDKLMIQVIRNSSFMNLAGRNKFKAEQLANEEMAKRIRILSGQDFIESEQNIDDTDILKVSNTAGYMTVEEIKLSKPLVDQDDFNKYIRQMIFNSHSIKSEDPGAARIGVIMNINPESESAIDYSFTNIIETYGKPFEIFTQKQWDGNREYLQLIVSGMKMPIAEIEDIYKRYQQETERVNKNADSFYAQSKNMVLEDSDSIFDMISEKQPDSVSKEDFLKSLQS